MKKLVYYFLVFASIALVAFTAAFEHRGGKGKEAPFRNHSNAVIIAWNATAFETMGPTYNPLLASRILAMMHLAMHDALNNIAPVYDTYAYHRAEKKADPIAAVSAAAHSVLVGSFPDKREQLDAALERALKDVKSGGDRDRGIILGEDAGQAILLMRSKDGAFADPVGKLDNPDQPGFYQPTPPTPFVFAPFWTAMPTFALKSPWQFRIGPMPALTSKEYSEDFKEVQRKGSKTNSTRTSEETFIANFWYEFSEIGWNRITVTAVRDTNLDLVATARLFALVNMSLADSYTAGWDSKFHHNFWRPYTAIRNAACDNNDQTNEDAAWEPLLNTPPVHDYPSTHSVLGNAAATILAGTLGDRSFTMTSTSAVPTNTTRTLKSFTYAAIENGDSRVFAGIHFRFSCESGLALGKDIGDWILNTSLKPKAKPKA
ncbi:MAG TPA: phosphatase PAP2 family protein [Chryseolinea sp.]|nr:phosphatase PAP2 family protein [Chryseolinea sp.]